MGRLSLEEVAELARSMRAKNKKIVFTNGCFDILHVGHVRYLADAKRLGDLLIVGLNTDDCVKRLKGPKRPIQSEQNRAEILLALKSVDYVTLFSEDTPIQLIEAIEPDVLVKGGDWAVKDIVGSDFVLSKGGEVQSLPFHKGQSTTSIVNKMEEGSAS